MTSFGITNTLSEPILIDGYDFPFGKKEAFGQGCFLIKDGFQEQASLNETNGDVTISPHSYVEFYVDPLCFVKADESQANVQRLFSINHVDMRALAFLGYTYANPMSSQISYKYVNTSAWIMPLRSLTDKGFLILNVNESGR